jgi:hypothetical protein
MVYSRANCAIMYVMKATKRKLIGFAAVLMLLAVAAGCRHRAPVKFTTFKSDELRFSVQLPEGCKVEKSEKTLDEKIGRVKMTSFTARGKDADFEVIAYEKPAVASDARAARGFLEFVLGRAESQGAVAGRNKTSIDDFQARELRLKTPGNQFLRVALFEVGGTLFQLQVSSKNKKYLDGPEAANFFKTFKYEAPPPGNMPVKKPEPAKPDGQKNGREAGEKKQKEFQDPYASAPQSFAYTDRLNHFTVELPAPLERMNYQASMLDTPYGKRAGETYTAQKGDAIYSVTILKQLVKPGDTRTMDYAMDLFGKNLGETSEILHVGTGSLDGRNTFTMRVSTGEGNKQAFSSMVIFFISDAQYMLAVIGRTAAALDAPESRLFLESFKHEKE